MFLQGERGDTDTNNDKLSGQWNLKKKGGNGCIMYSWLSYDGVKNLMYCVHCVKIYCFSNQ